MTKNGDASSASPVVLGIVVTVLMAMPVTILYVGVRRAIEVAGAARHDTVEGVVISSGVEELRDSGTRVGEPSTSTYRPLVRYTYSYNGKTHAASRVTQFGESSTRPWAEAIASQFRPGDRIPVRLDQKSPHEPYLVPGAASVLPWFFILIGGIPCAAFLWLTCRRVVGSFLQRVPPSGAGAPIRPEAATAAQRRRRTMAVVMAAIALSILVVGTLIRPVCVPLSATDLVDFNVPIEQRTDVDLYLRVFQRRGEQWYQCKTWLSRALFF